MKEEIEQFKRRAEKFERDANYDYEQGDFDIAMFHLEQAMQLQIKTKLLELKGSFIRTHSLRLLISELKEIFKGKELNRFLEKNKIVLRNLERAYISARYVYEEFLKEEVEESFKTLKKLKELLWKD